MLNFPTAIIGICALLLLPTSVHAGQQSRGVSPHASQLNAAQKVIFNKVVGELIKTEQLVGQQMYVPLYKDRVAVMITTVNPLLSKLPGGETKKCLTLAVQTHEDLVTVLTETSKYPYYDLISDKQTPKIIKKYGLTLDLHSSEPYGRLEQDKIEYLTNLLGQVAIALRQRAQEDCR